MNAPRTTTGLGALMLAAALASTLAQGLRPGPVWSQATDAAYGAKAADSAGDWLATNGPALETSLMAWCVKPAPPQLRQLQR